LNEALAAGLILLSGWKYSEPLYDMFCGSGTIAIEAALLAKNIAPGLLRTFAFEQFAWYDQSLLEKEIAFAQSKIMTDREHHIFASDLDPKMIKIAKINAQNA
jgi:putative N6-adenine-specific DNA methylase